MNFCKFLDNCVPYNNKKSLVKAIEKDLVLLIAKELDQTIVICGGIMFWEMNFEVESYFNFPLK
jgi:hypothetical protein